MDSFGRPVLLEKAHPGSGFDCGDGALNRFLRDYAWQSQRSGASRTYVSLANEGEVAGFYTLAAGSVGCGDAPERLRKGLPRHDIPMVLLARLAVSLPCQGKGLGAGLLRDALLRALDASEIIGARGVVVDAKDENAASFYRRFGFEPFESNALRLHLLFKGVRRLLEE